MPIQISNHDPLSRFYTKLAVSTALVAQMRDGPSANVLDLGSGPGALSQAARARWKDARIVSVDIDRDAESCLQKLPHLKRGGGHAHIVADALAPNLPSVLSDLNFDTAVCNPPYRLASWRPSFARILEEGGLGGLTRRGRDASVETLFLAQNLRIVRAGGQLGLVVPDTLISGRKSRSLRETLLAQHRIECVVQLPRGSFVKTDAQAFLLVLNKGQPDERKTVLIRLNSKGQMSKGLAIDRGQAEHRLDYDYYAAQSEKRYLQPTLSDLNAHVTRGSLENAFMREHQPAKWAFHTTHFPSETGKGGLLFPKQKSSSFPPGITWAEPGDILVARVDRSLHKKVYLVQAGRAPITECVFRIRLPTQWRHAVYNALISVEGQTRLLSISRGVAARMISKHELLRMPLELRNG